jgi:hypothetical protein
MPSCRGLLAASRLGMERDGLGARGQFLFCSAPAEASQHKRNSWSPLAGDEVIMSIAGHVSRAMLSRYSHVRMEAKRRALDEVAARQHGRKQSEGRPTKAAGASGWPTEQTVNLSGTCVELIPAKCSEDSSRPRGLTSGFSRRIRVRKWLIILPWRPMGSQDGTSSRVPL